jgi:hypothetical protein
MVRASDGDRDKVIKKLVDGAVDGAVSTDTFERRVDAALKARHRPELHAIVRDLPSDGRLMRRVTGMITAASAFTKRVETAWRVPRLPRLALPAPGKRRLVIGRAPGCHVMVVDPTVSRVHAELVFDGEGWFLSDLGSMNGTQVNGRRLTGPAIVVPGDEIGFGHTSFVLDVA